MAVAVVVLGIRLGTPSMGRWVGSSTPATSSTPSTSTIPPGPCKAAFGAAIAAGTNEARLATLTACNEQEWIAQQAESPLPGATLRELCEQRAQVTTATCATPDAEVLQELAARRTAEEHTDRGYRRSGESPNSVGPQITGPLPGQPSPPAIPYQPSTGGPSPRPAPQPAPGPSYSAPGGAGTAGSPGGVGPSF